MAEKLDTTLAILNGLIGDYLARTNNELATAMELWSDGARLPIDRAGLSSAGPRPILLIHGLMCNESIWSFEDGSGTYGSKLAAEFGFTPLYLRYNSGRPIPDNGAALSELLERLIDVYPPPIEELVLLGYSMGGLVARSACHVAKLEGKRWLSFVRRAFYVGVPHLGAPLERAGRVLTKMLRAIDDPYTKLIAEIGDVRSAGVKDLGDARLRHEDLDKPLSIEDPRHPVPLFPEIEHYLIAGRLDGWIGTVFGDALVPIASATHGEGIAPDHLQIIEGATHLELAHDPRVHDQLRLWCGGPK